MINKNGEQIEMETSKRNRNGKQMTLHSDLSAVLATEAAKEVQMD